MYKNIEKKVKLSLKDQVEYQDGQVVSKTLVQNEIRSTSNKPTATKWRRSRTN